VPKFEIGSAAIHYEDIGTGDPIILLHSSAMSGQQWRSLVDQLSDRHRCLVPDLYGYGQSPSWPGPGPLDLDDEAEIVAGMLAVAGAPAHLVGHSYGGAVALQVAARTGGRLLRSLLMFEPVAFQLLADRGGADTGLYDEIHGLATRVTQAVGSGDPNGGMEIFVDYWNGVGTWEALQDAARDELVRRAGKIVIDFAAIFGCRTPSENYANLDIPVHILAGDRSTEPARRTVEIVAQIIPKATVETIAGVGHMAPVADRSVVNERIIERLQQTAGFDRPADITGK
jgi:pimeloyl-ACP methyl ester carboxylesterase